SAVVRGLSLLLLMPRSFSPLPQPRLVRMSTVSNRSSQRRIRGSAHARAGRESTAGSGKSSAREGLLRATRASRDGLGRGAAAAANAGAHEERGHQGEHDQLLHNNHPFALESWTKRPASPRYPGVSREMFAGAGGIASKIRPLLGGAEAGDASLLAASVGVIE